RRSSRHALTICHTGKQMPVSHRKKPSKTERLIGVVDIGSNSVRLVIYRIERGAPVAVKDKKAACKLADGMHHLHPELNARGVEKTLKALKSFRALLAKHKVTQVLAIGTAAMRAVADTPKGKAFHRKAELALGHAISVISGREEAQLTAHGVMAALPK